MHKQDEKKVIKHLECAVRCAEDAKYMLRDTVGKDSVAENELDAGISKLYNVCDLIKHGRMPVDRSG